jgi:hypothetical protein
VTARDHWRQVERETNQRRHDRARWLAAEREEREEREGGEAMAQYQSSACLQERHLDCRDAACRCWRCGCLEQRARDQASSLIAQQALAAATVTFHCEDCGRPLSLANGGGVFTCCDECWDKYYKQASPYERQQARDRR